MQITTHTSLDDSLYAEWKKLWDRSSSANFVNNPEWFRSTCALSGESTQMLIVTARQDSALIAVVPLLRDVRYGIPCYSLIPADFVYGDPVLTADGHPTVFKTIYQQVLATKTIVFDNVTEKFASSIGANRYQTLIPYGKNFQMEIILDDQGSALIPNKQKLLYKSRKFLPRFKLRAYAGSDIEILTRIIDMDQKTSKQKKGINAFAQESTRELYRSLSEYMGKQMAYHVLYFDDQPCAYEIGFKIGSTYYGSQLAYVSEFSKLSPGKVLVILLIELLAKSSVKKIDFGSGESGIKESLATSSQPFYKLIVTTNIFHKLVLGLAYTGRDFIFGQLTKHARVYSAYRHLRGVTA